MSKSLLNEENVEQLARYRVLWLGLSGGLDSRALLHALVAHPVLKRRLQVIHVHHGLSPNATEWAEQCQAWCHQDAIPFTSHLIDLPSGGNLEARARQARYDVFDSKVTSNDALILAHHVGDQAETLMLNLLRGAGIEGISAMQAIQPRENGDVLRPLLALSRDHIQAYAENWGLTWVEDESNHDEHFSRNFLRHQVMPLLKTRWPTAVQNIARTARHAQAAQQNTATLAMMDCPELAHAGLPLRLEPLCALSRERLMNVLRCWIKHEGQSPPSTVHLDQIMNDVILARRDAMPSVTWGDTIIRRYRDRLYCVDPLKRNTEAAYWRKLQDPMIGNEVKKQLAERGCRASLAGRVEVRFRQGGESFFWHSQTKSLKKLFQEWGVPPWLRDTVPLIFCDDRLAVVVGYAVGDHFIETGEFTCPNL